MDKEYDLDTKEWVEMYDRIDYLWNEPNLTGIKIKIGRRGSSFGKWTEFLMAGLILMGTFPGIIQFIMRAFSGESSLPAIGGYSPIFLEFLSYVPIMIVILYLTLKFVLRSHRLKKQAKKEAAS